MNSTEIDYGVTRALNISVQATDGISSIDIIIISHNATGTWQNYTMPLNGTTNFYFNITDVSSMSLGNVFMWLFYANDTAGVWQKLDNIGANYSIVVADLSANLKIYEEVNCHEKFYLYYYFIILITLYAYR